MGHRLSKIYTRTGDAGTTGLGDGGRTSKNGARIRAIGDVDELNCVIGVLLCESLAPGIHDTLRSVQHDLFDLGGELSIPGSTLLPDGAVKRLEAAIDQWNEDLPPLKEFILPGGSRAAAACHLGRAVCRRAERAIVELSEGEGAGALALGYINRLSDLLFVLARALARADGGAEILWDRSRLVDAPD
jgi:cob(I)alamin adenosyltransferase